MCLQLQLLKTPPPKKPVDLVYPNSVFCVFVTGVQHVVEISPLHDDFR